MDLGVFKLGIFDGHFDREKPWEPMVFHHDELVDFQTA